MSSPTPEPRARRAKRQDTAGVSQEPRREPFTRTVSIVDAALRVWEAKHSGGRVKSIWARRSET